MFAHRREPCNAYTVYAVVVRARAGVHQFQPHGIRVLCLQRSSSSSSSYFIPFTRPRASTLHHHQQQPPPPHSPDSNPTAGVRTVVRGTVQQQQQIPRKFFFSPSRTWKCTSRGEWLYCCSGVQTCCFNYYRRARSSFIDFEVGFLYSRDSRVYSSSFVSIGLHPRCALYIVLLHARLDSRGVIVIVVVAATAAAAFDVWPSSSRCDCSRNS